MRMEQKLTPQLIQSMSILQLPAMALENRVAEELENNYALEVSEPEHAAEAPPREERPGDNGDAASFEHLERLAREYGSDEFFSTSYHGRRPANFEERDAKLDAMANVASRPVSLAEHLLTQWAVTDVPEDVRRAGEAIIYSLEDDGYLRTHLWEIGERLKPPVSPEVMEEALRRVQRLDPVGVAAREYQECLLVQLEALPGDNRIEKTLIQHHLADIIRNRYPAIAKATGYSVGEITEAVKAMHSTLSLHPAYRVIEPPTQRIIPDVIIEPADTGGGFEVRLARGNSPRLRISASALEMLKDKGASKEVREFVRNHVENASALIDAIRFRRERLLAVAQHIVERQRDFFDIGPEGLKVLRMSDLAEDLECDPSTISRTVAGKYVQTPRGIYPLRYFFSGGTQTADGESTSWDSVKASVQKIIDEEDKSNPLRDDQIAEILSKRGVEISRRTVAKYRQQLEIPPARQRRQFDA